MGFPCIVIIILSAVSCGFAGDIVLNVPPECRQILRVTTRSWDENAGTMLRLQKSPEGKWSEVGKPIPVSVGRNGLAWGWGFHEGKAPGPVKKEGDGRAPAGVFSFGTAFGYAEKAPAGCRLPYRQATEHDYFVDDPKSPYYNQWVHFRGEKKPWGSAESMRLRNHLYELGIVVNHNMKPPVENAGSAIFIHIWRGPGMPTAGCTAMSRENVQVLLKWLNPEVKPVLIQSPEGVLGDRY